MPKNRTFHYVTHERIADWLNCGWMIAIPNGVMHHHVYGVLMEWCCGCPMARPE